MDALAAVAAELKRWNRKLEAENARLYAVIDRLQARDGAGAGMLLGSGGDRLALGWEGGAGGAGAGGDGLDAVAVLPLAAFLEEFGALKTLENIAFAAQGGRRAETAML